MFFNKKNCKIDDLKKLKIFKNHDKSKNSFFHLKYCKIDQKCQKVEHLAIIPVHKKVYVPILIIIFAINSQVNFEQ